jgi:hypothetical protein
MASRRRPACSLQREHIARACLQSRIAERKLTSQAEFDPSRAFGDDLAPEERFATQLSSPKILAPSSSARIDWRRPGANNEGVVSFCSGIRIVGR